MTENIFIVGGGIVGLTLAALLAKNNFSVSVIEEKKPVLHWDKNNVTARVSAIHLTSSKLFDYLNLPEIMDYSAPLYEMQIGDHTGNTHLHFDSRDADETQMGFIVENRIMVKKLWEKLMQDERVTLICPHSPDDHVFPENKLIIGADGAHSWVRKQMRVTMYERSYQQKAIIAVIESEKPHNNIAIQKFLTTGPVALLPLTHSHHTALVWSADNEISDDLVNEYASENYALVGDAAHTIHPLAGLGVNLGLTDAAALTQVLIDARDNKKPLGSIRTLRRYTRWRKADNTSVINMMRALQETFAIDTNAFNLLRTLGINTLDQCVLGKKQLINIAMGKHSETPKFLQI